MTSIINYITKSFSTKIEEVHPFPIRQKENLSVCMIIYVQVQYWLKCEKDIRYNLSLCFRRIPDFAISIFSLYSKISINRPPLVPKFLCFVPLSGSPCNVKTVHLH